jgi:uncharacterized OB-fold protein
MSAHDPAAAIPLPRLTDWNRPYFRAALEGRLMLQRCRACGECFYYPRPACPECLGMEHDWVELSGRGTVYSFAVVWRPQHPAFLDRVPITLATIQLDDGPQLVSNVVNCPPERVAIGLRVRVVFERVNDEVALPKFEPAGASSRAVAAPAGGGQVTT